MREDRPRSELEDEHRRRLLAAILADVVHLRFAPATAQPRTIELPHSFPFAFEDLAGTL